jgi:TPR repeat protein
MKILAALALCLCITTAQADLFDDAQAAYLRKDYATALRMYRSLAEQGSVYAQSYVKYNLGFMYRHGKGTPQDYAEALKWFRLAAEQGNAGAQFNLAIMYDEGKGTPQDYVEAVKWYRLGAEQRDASGQFNLGFMYENGHGVLQDYVEAHKWYNLSATRETEEKSKHTHRNPRQNCSENDTRPNSRSTKTS